MQDIVCSPSITVTAGNGNGGVPACTASVNANNSVTLVWDAVPGITSFQLRRNNAWLASTGNVLTAVDTPGIGTWSYEIRYWQGGANDIVCSPTVTVN